MECRQVSAECPVEASVYGYYPNLGANVFFAAFFGVSAIVNLVLGIRFRSWTFMTAAVLGSVTECLGYVGRVLMHGNPYDSNGFQIQICCLIIAPAFVAAGIYLILKHIVICFGEQHSFLKARFYTWIFISCDLFSLVLQAVGGGMAATANEGDSLLDVGSDIMMAGICFQVVTMTVFGTMAAVYYFRLHRSEEPLSPSAESVKSSTRFRLFLAGFVLAYLTIFIRCIYRIAEMEGGWGSELMQNEVDFIVLDGVMIAVAVFAMTAFHPGYCFPQMISQAKKPKLSDVEQKKGSSGMSL